METLLPHLLIAASGLCCYFLIVFMSENSARKTLSQKPTLDTANLRSPNSAPEYPELTDPDIIRGYDSPEVARSDTLIRVRLFLQTAKRPINLD